MKLGEVASKYPYYKYNGLWTRDVQNAVREPDHWLSKLNAKSIQIFAIVLCGWLGGFPSDGAEARIGRLLTIEEVGEILEGTRLSDQTELFID